MKTYVACIGEEAVLAFRAENDDDAHSMIDDEEGSIRSDLTVLVGTDENALWDGKSILQVREATAAQHAEWEQSRDQAISDERTRPGCWRRPRSVERLFNEDSTKEIIWASPMSEVKRDSR